MTLVVWAVVILAGTLVLIVGAVLTAGDRGRLRAALDARDRRRVQIEARIRAARVGHGDLSVLVRPAWQVAIRTHRATFVQSFASDTGVPPEVLAARLLSRLTAHDQSGGRDGPPSSRGPALQQELAELGHAPSVGPPDVETRKALQALLSGELADDEDLGARLAAVRRADQAAAPALHRLNAQTKRPQGGNHGHQRSAAHRVC